MGNEVMSAGQLLKQANQLKRAGRLDEAIALYYQVIEINPNFAWTYNNLGDALVKQGNLDEAVAYYQQSFKINPSSPWVLYRLGQTLAKQGNLEAAVEYLQKAIEIKPNFYKFYNSLGQILTEKGDFDEGIASYQNAVKLNPEKAYIHYNLGSALVKSELLEDAVIAYHRAIDLDLRFSENSFLAVGEAHFHQKEYNKTILFLELATRLNVQNENAFLLLGRSFLYTNQFAEAVKVLRKALILDDKNESIYFHLVCGLVELKKFEGARKYLEQSLKDGVESPRLYHLLGKSLDNLGQTEEGIKFYYQAIDTTSPKPRYYSDLAVALAKIGDFDSSLEKFAKAIELSPDNQSYYTERCLVCMEIADFEQAQKDVEMVLKLAPGNVKAENKRQQIIALRQKLAIQVNADIEKAAQIKKQIQLLETSEDKKLHKIDYFLSFSQYSNRILELVKTNPGQMSFEEYLYIVETMLQSVPGNLLVFGMGKDSELWREVNQGGRTVFLEDNLYWLKKSSLINPNTEAYLVEYNSKRKDWIKLLKDSNDSVECLSLELPDGIKNTQWQWILVDAPRGTSDETPGRMKSIYTAANLAYKFKKTHVFVHDCNRDVENIYSGYFFNKKHFVKKVEKLCHYVVII